MKRFIIATTIVLPLLIAGCSPSDNEKNTSPSTQEAGALNSATENGGTTQAVVILDQETQARIDLRIERVGTTNLAPEVKGYGQVVDPAPLSSLVSEYVAARANADASQKELERMKTLAAQDNASLRALQAAEATTVRDRASVSSAWQKLLVSWGAAITELPDLEEFVQNLAIGETALLQIYLPAGESLKSPPLGARIIPLTGEMIEAQFVGVVPTTDPVLQGQGFFFIVEQNDLRLKPAAALAGWLRESGEPKSGSIVPESAIVRHQEQAWVYVQSDSTRFVRTPVALTRPFGNGWFVTEALKPGDRFVVHGAQSLLSEELKSQIQLGD